MLEPLTLVTGGCSQDQGSNFPVIELGYHLLYRYHYHCITRAPLLYLCLYHMGSEYVSREKKITMVNFLIFVQKNVSTTRFQEIKIRPFGDFEKMRFLCFYIIKSMAQKGYFGPKSDFRGSKIPPRVAEST